MGSIKKGILGGFSGKVGTVIGASWKGVSYMRGRAVAINNPNTEKQQTQRSKMAFVMNFLKPIMSVINRGWQSAKMSPINAAVSRTLKEATNVVGDTISIIFSKLVLTTGPLVSCVRALADQTSSGVTFVPVSFGGDSTDYVHCAVYHEATGKWWTSESVTQGEWMTRADNEVGFAWLGTGKHQVYIYFVSHDLQKTSDSFYAGEFTKSA